MIQTCVVIVAYYQVIQTCVVLVAYCQVIQTCVVLGTYCHVIKTCVVLGVQSQVIQTCVDASYFVPFFKTDLILICVGFDNHPSSSSDWPVLDYYRQAIQI